MRKFKQVPSQVKYPDLEEKITKFWKDKKIFEKSVEQRSEDNLYRFLDGPPFPSGMPHYGHLLMSVAKDVIPRYQTMKGKRVRRVWGWDCHGIAVESKVNKELGISTRRNIEEYGIANYVRECRNYVQRQIANWGWYIEKIGRWVDMENAYYTLYPEYHESVLWAFKQVWEKGFVYKGKRVSLFSVETGTPVSDFEVAEGDDYREIEDLSVFVKFKLNYHKTGVGVGVVIENEKGEVLTVTRNENGREPLIGIIGGKRDGKETLQETVSRETLEEIGVEIDEAELIGSSLDVFEGRLFHTYHFKAFLPSDTDFKICDEVKDLKWKKKENIDWDNMHIPTRHCLEDFYGIKKFPEIGENLPDIYLLAWTTTPWTLLSNFAIGVNPDFDYALYEKEGEYFIVEESRAEYVFGDDFENYNYLYSYKGKEFSGIKYEPLYDYFVEKANENDYKVYLYDGVSNEEGTGVLHIAPGFGEEDFNLGREFGLSDFADIDEEGKMVVGSFVGEYIRDASPKIAEELEDKGNLLRSLPYVHRLPFYRGNEPLIYMAQDQYFIDIQRIKERMLELNENINWIPEGVKKTRFPAVINSAPDWAISRNRYWATVMPVWRSDDGDEIVVGGFEEMMEYTDEIEMRETGSSKEFFLKKTGEKLSAHRDKLDDIVFTKNGKKYHRIEEVLDVWFDSGSAPFAEFHYPFENKELFEKSYPADFIVEGAGMVRAWFNVLHRVATLVFDKEAFKNVVCGGTFAGSDGRKMSKTYGNYTDPKDVLENLGGETLRLYLMGSAVMAGGEANWSDEILSEMQKNILIPFWNVYKYFVIYANLHKFIPLSLIHI